MTLWDRARLLAALFVLLAGAYALCGAVRLTNRVETERANYYEQARAAFAQAKLTR